MDLESSRRVLCALAASQRLNALLEARVRGKQRELERQFETLQRLTRQAAPEQRRRLMAHVHDGIGASLIATPSLVECGEASSEQVATALRECIDDLRLAIDSLEPADGDLPPVLGGPRLEAQGITLDWQVREIPKLACLTPRNVLHVLRILQEAFTNVLKHARAIRLRVGTRIDADRVSIEVGDDGRAFDGTPLGQGHGPDHMRKRAKASGGDLRIVLGAAGTTLSLSPPIG